MASCPACGRRVAVARATCLYCGAALPLGSGRPRGASRRRPPGRRGRTERVLVLLDLDGREPADARRGARRVALRGDPAGAPRRTPPGPRPRPRRRGRGRGGAAARRGARRPWLVPEAEVRTPPLGASPARGRATSELSPAHHGGAGRPSRGATRCWSCAGRSRASTSRPPSGAAIDTARLEEGYRVHLHRRADPRALEIDALNFEVGFAVDAAPPGSRSTPGSRRCAATPRATTASGACPRRWARPAPEPGGALAAAGIARASPRGGGGASEDRSCSTTSRSSASTRAGSRPSSGDA